jgi:hypothetical protein
LQPHTQPFQANLKRLGINATSRIVDPRNISAGSTNSISTSSAGRSAAARSPAIHAAHRLWLGSGQDARLAQFRRIASPAIDAMIEKIGQAHSYVEVRRRRQGARPPAARGALLDPDVVEPQRAGWPIGTCMTARRPSRNMAPAHRRSGGTTLKRPSALERLEPGC